MASMAPMEYVKAVMPMHIDTMLMMRSGVESAEMSPYLHGLTLVQGIAGVVLSAGRASGAGILAG